MADPYHSGERAIQEETGERDRALLNAGGISDTIPERAVGFVAEQEMAVLGAADYSGNLWAGILSGAKGFATVEGDLRTVRFDLTEEDVRADDRPFPRLLCWGRNVGILFIDLATRRRLRVNGYVAERDAEGLVLAVDEAYLNCPKYIQRRTVRERAPAPGDGGLIEGEGLTECVRSWIASADTFFVASAGPGGLPDASHRGGPPGFVRIEGEGLRIPDYPGNSMFNTLGNFRFDPRAGLCFPDFETGHQLQLTGDASLDLDAGEEAGESGGTGRWWRFRPRRWIISPITPPLAWTFIDASPFNPRDSGS